jgi:superfamily II DNA/RNA helicase
LLPGGWIFQMLSTFSCEEMDTFWDMPLSFVDVLTSDDCCGRFDFPMNSVDYLHRAGRTARFGRKGAVTSLVTKRDTTLASAIERAVMRSEPLDQLSNDRRDYLPGGRLAKQSPSSKQDMESAAGRAKAKVAQAKNRRSFQGVRRGEGRGTSGKATNRYDDATRGGGGRSSASPSSNRRGGSGGGRGR